ncbi:KPN_02809 family neutral zinc metallopeptidase [Sphingomonas sp. CFBP 8760]|uniref:KPN_02809 family neutral zinc metallopeptidase n=1 Tax=Sphingomonas sp. CFBP 8760 TaxID=2775282 RepID=UPI0017821F23|nr:neutral zinc metallopeptidase [Sphingomonas sp. CFBP 8760]MBD8548919.1 zinc metallopeptidase [Sphingomonas sp. CFBP 8760]
MRLDDYDPNDINVGDQRGEGGGGGGFGGGGGGLLLGLLPMIGSRFGCGGIVVVLIILAVMGLNPLSLLGGGGGSNSTQVTRSAPAGENEAATACAVNPESRASCQAFNSAQRTWVALFAKSNQEFAKPTLQFYGGSGKSGCGAAQAAMGPFYCPTDRGIYLDTSFFNELANRFGAKGDFAQYYVIAHEFGHHIQNLLGTSDQVQRIQRTAGEREGNAASVRLELQADCYAGVWAAANRNQLEPGDLEEGMTAARAIGDDTLQREGQGRVVPDSFTHGSSEQRMRWLRRGLETGDPAQCDTFSGAI